MPIVKAVTAHVSGRAWASASRPIPLNLYNEPFDVGFGVSITTAFSSASGMTVDVEHTFDDITKAGVSAHWFDHSSVSGISVGRPVDGSYTEPIAAVRVAVNGSSNAANASARAVTLKVIQTGW